MPEACRLTPQDDMEAVHALLTEAFAYMEGRIDPPSSLNRMTPHTLRKEAATKELWAILDPHPVACMILTPKTDTLYLGKLATAASHRSMGLSRRLIDIGLTRARALGLLSITLETRVELVRNQKFFTSMGFTEVTRTAHTGYDRPTSITYRLWISP